MRAWVPVIAGLLTAAVVLPGRPPHAQPVDKAELERAKDLYRAAEAAVAEGRFDDAARDYGAAYEITKAPELFFKIASANDKAHRCDVAVIYFKRYLKEGKPTPEFVKITNERIVACGGTVEPVDTGSGSGTGSAGSGSATPGSGSAPGPGSGSGSGVDVGSGAAPPPPLVLTPKHRTAWLLVGGSLTFVTLGAVLGYSASAAEEDIADLYVGFNGHPPTFDAKTAARRQELLDQGHRYEKLSWLSLGIAGALAAGAAISFVLDPKDDKETKLHLTPVVAPGAAGVSARLKF